MMCAAEGPAPEVLDYTAVMAERLLTAVDGEVCAVYLHGSAALGGWSRAVSDVDLLVLIAHQVDTDAATALSAAAVSTLGACPGTGLELSVVTRVDAAKPKPPWRFVTHVAAAKGSQPRVVPGATHPGDPDLLLHYVVCRQAGWPVLGPPATDLIGPVSRGQVLNAQARELTWALEQAPAHYTLLTACRALVLLQQRRLVGKTTTGRWAIKQAIGSIASVADALATQAGAEPPRSPTAADAAFIRHTINRLTAAAQAEQDSSSARPR